MGMYFVYDNLYNASAGRQSDKFSTKRGMQTKQQMIIYTVNPNLRL